MATLQNIGLSLAALSAARQAAKNQQDQKFDNISAEISALTQESIDELDSAWKQAIDDGKLILDSVRDGKVPNRATIAVVRSSIESVFQDYVEEHKDLLRSLDEIGR